MSIRLKAIRVLAVIDGELELEEGQELLRLLSAGQDVTDLILSNQEIEVQLIGAAQQMHTCVGCGVTFDIDDDETRVDVECDVCGEGPFCSDCLETHDCASDHELPLDDI